LLSDFGEGLITPSSKVIGSWDYSKYYNLCTKWIW